MSKFYQAYIGGTVAFGIRNADAETLADLEETDIEQRVTAYEPRRTFREAKADLVTGLKARQLAWKQALYEARTLRVIHCDEPTGEGL